MIEKINESVKIQKYKKLRDAIHDIVVELDKDSWLTVKQLSEELKKFNIKINELTLNKILDNWQNKKDYTILDILDDEWLFYDKDNNSVFTTLKFPKPPSLAKSRKNIIKEEIKKRKEQEEKRKEEIIENVDKIEEKDPIKCPISTIMILDTFENIEEEDVIKIKKFIEKSINNKEVEHLYEPAWYFMVKKVSDDILNGGLGYSLKNTWNKHKPNTKKWVIPVEEDFDNKVIIWHYKYGEGKIDTIYDDVLSINFDSEKIIKRIKIKSSLLNKSIRINRSFKKRPIDIEGYRHAYLKDLEKGDQVYHKKRGYGEVIENFKYSDDIKFLFSLKNIKMTKNEFLINQNILISDKMYNKIEKRKLNNKSSYKSSYNNYNYSNHIPSGYSLLKNINDIKEGDMLYIKKDGYIYITKNHLNSIKNGYGIFRNNKYIYLKPEIIKNNIYKKNEERITKFKDYNNGWSKVNSINDLEIGDIIKYRDKEYKITLKGKTWIDVKNEFGFTFSITNMFDNIYKKD